MHDFQEKMRPELLETLHQRLSCYDDFLSDKEWLMGEKVCLICHLDNLNHSYAL